MSMTDYYTRAVVLSREQRQEQDDAVTLYTESLGKVIARSKSSKKIDSKLSGHLEPGRLVRVRLIKGNNYKIVDALSESSLINSEVARFLGFINSMSAFEAPDPHLWHAIHYVIQNKLFLDESSVPKEKIYNRFLEIFGYGAKFAKCQICEQANSQCQVSYFSPYMLGFLCSKSLKSFRIDEEELVKI